MRIGFIGVGSQGAPMTRRIIDAGYETTLWARRSASLEPFSGTPAKIAGSPAELAAGSDLVCLCVVSDADVQEIISGQHGILAGIDEGGVIAIHSTVHPDTCRSVADNAAGHGVAVIDAPVSGGGQAAAAGNLLVMVGGETKVVERCRPVFSTYGNPVVHMGALGSGQVAKLLNNLLFTANLGAAADTFALGRSLGVEPEALAEVITRGSAHSYAVGSIVAGGGTVEPIAALAGPLLNKDVALVSGLADAADISAGIALTAADGTLGLMNHPR